MVYYQ